MAVQLTPNASNTLIQAQEAARAAATRRADSLQEAAAAVVGRGTDTVNLTANPAAAKVSETHGALAAAQRGMGALNVAGHSLAEATQHLGWIGSVVASGKSDPSARLAVADGLANLDKAMRSARFEGANVLDGTDFSAAGVKVSVGSDDLQNLASLLASGGRGMSALNLDNNPAAVRTMQKANDMVSAALGQISTQAAELDGLFGRLEGSVGALSATSIGSPAAASSDAAAAIAAAPGAAAEAQANVTATAAARLLAD